MGQHIKLNRGCLIAEGQHAKHGEVFEKNKSVLVKLYWSNVLTSMRII